LLSRYLANRICFADPSSTFRHLYEVIEKAFSQTPSPQGLRELTSLLKEHKTSFLNPLKEAVF